MEIFNKINQPKEMTMEKAQNNDNNNNIKLRRK